MIGGTSAMADDSVNTGYFGGVAIMGYDPVAYFTEGKAVKGSEKFSYDWLERRGTSPARSTRTCS